VEISGYRQLVIRGNNSAGFYQTVGVFGNGTLQIGNSLCYFNRINFPSSITSLADGVTGFEKTTSTLFHCVGSLVSKLLDRLRYIIQSDERMMI